MELQARKSLVSVINAKILIFYFSLTNLLVCFRYFNYHTKAISFSLKSRSPSHFAKQVCILQLIIIHSTTLIKYFCNTIIFSFYFYSVEWLIVDEADKLFEEGIRGFREQLDEITRACTNADLRRGMFSATNTPAVSKWCRHNMRGLVTVGHRYNN